MKVSKKVQEILLIQDIDKKLEELCILLESDEIDLPENYKYLSYCLIKVAKIYYEKRNYDEALWYCQELIKNNYAYKEPYILMAKMYNEMQMPTLAIGCLKAAEEYGILEDYLDSDNIEVALYDTYSKAYTLMNNIDMALIYSDKILELTPEDLLALKNQRILLKQKLTGNKDTE